MAYYSRDARRHAERIDYYYAHAGEFGYAQAHYHLTELEKLLQRANRSTRGMSDLPVIQAILDGVRPKMDEMKRRENEAGDR